MSSDRFITRQATELLDRVAPPGQDAAFNAIGPRGRGFRYHIRIFFNTAMALFCMAVFYYGALRLAAYMHHVATHPSEMVFDGAPVQTSPVFMPAVLTDPPILPGGKITAPLSHTITDRTVTISGYKANLPVDTPFVWLVVDVPLIGRCWPKKPVIQPNGTFQATIFEGGPSVDYTVSLYAVGNGLNKTIEQWIVAGTIGGLPMIPQQYRLDSVRLSLNGV